MAIDFAAELLDGAPAAPPPSASPAPNPAASTPTTAVSAPNPAPAAPVSQNPAPKSSKIDFAADLMGPATTAAPAPAAAAPAKPKESGIMATVQGFIQGLSGGLEERSAGMLQASGLDKALFKAMKVAGEIPDNTTFDEFSQRLRVGVTGARDDIKNAAAQRPGVKAGAVTADIGLTTAASVPAMLLPGGPLAAALTTGGVGGFVEGATRSEGVGENRNRVTDAAVGTGLGVATGGILHGAGAAYSKFLAPTVQPYISKATGAVTDGLKTILNNAGAKGAGRWSDYGKEVLKNAGYDPAKVADDVADGVLKAEADALANRRSVVTLINRAGKVDPSQVKANAQVFQNLGIQPTLGQVTDNAGLLKLEETLALNPDQRIASPLLKRGEEQARNELPAATQTLINKLNPKSYDDVADTVVKTAQAAIDKLVSARQKVASPRYLAAGVNDGSNPILVGGVPITAGEESMAVAGNKLSKEDAGALVSGASKNFVNKLITVESGGNAKAKAATSSATGLGQFIDSTWLRTLKKYRPDLAVGTKAEQLALRTDPTLNREMTVNLAQENGRTLVRAGQSLNDGSLYLAHFLGPADAVKVLKAAPGASVEGLVNDASVQANKRILQGKTAGQVIAWAERKMTGKAGMKYVGSGVAQDSERIYTNAKAEIPGGLPSTQDYGSSFFYDGSGKYSPLSDYGNVKHAYDLPKEVSSKLLDLSAAKNRNTLFSKILALNGEDSLAAQAAAGKLDKDVALEMFGEKNFDKAVESLGYFGVKNDVQPGQIRLLPSAVKQLKFVAAGDETTGGFAKALERADLQKPQTLYHGTAEAFDDFDPSRYGTGVGYDHQGGAVYLAGGQKPAAFFAKTAADNKPLADFRAGRITQEEYLNAKPGGSGTVMEVNLAPGTKILDLDLPENAQYRSALFDRPLSDRAGVPEYFKKLGYDGVRFNDPGLKQVQGVDLGNDLRTTVVFDPKKAVIAQPDLVPAAGDNLHDFTEFLGSKPMQEALRGIRSKSVFAEKLEGLPDNDMRTLDLAKKWIDDRIGGLRAKEGAKFESNLWKDTQKELLGYMDDATKVAADIPGANLKAGDSAYFKARQIFSSESEMVDDLTKGPIGALADLAEGNVGRATDRIFSMRAQDFTRVRDTLRGESADVWDAVVADHVQKTFMAGLREGGSEKLYQKLYRTKAQAELMDMALDHAPEKQALFRDLMKALQITQKVNLGGSQTFSRQAADRMADEISTPAPARALKAVDPAIVSRLGEWVSAAFRDANKARYANVMSSPQSVKEAVDEILTGKVSEFLMSNDGSKIGRAVKNTLLTDEDRALLLLRALGPVEKGLIYTKNAGSKALRRAIEQTPGRILNSPAPAAATGSGEPVMGDDQYEQFKSRMAAASAAATANQQ